VRRLSEAEAMELLRTSASSAETSRKSPVFLPAPAQRSGWLSRVLTFVANLIRRA